MKTFLKILFACPHYITLLLSSISYCQDGNIKISQDYKFEKLLNEKRKIYASLVADDVYRIQIFNGATDDARRNLSEFRREFPLINATVIFNTPNYKVIAGNFKTRIAAEYHLLEVRKIYKNAIVIKPKS